MPTFQENVRRCLSDYVGEKMWAGAWDRRSDRTELLPINVRPTKGDIISGYHRIQMPNNNHRFFVCRFVKSTLGPAAAFVPPFERREEDIVPDREWTELKDWAKEYGLAVRVYTDKMNVVYTGDAYILRRGINYFVALTERSLEKCLGREEIKRFVAEDDDYSVMISIEKNFGGGNPQENIKSYTEYRDVTDNNTKNTVNRLIAAYARANLSSLLFVNGELRRDGYTGVRISDVVEMTRFQGYIIQHEIDNIYLNNSYTKDGVERFIVHVPIADNPDNHILPFRDMVITAYSPENPDDPGVWMHIDDFAADSNDEEIFQITHNDISITRPAVDRLRSELNERTSSTVTTVKLKLFFRVHDNDLKMSPNGTWTDVLYGSGLTDEEISSYLYQGFLIGGGSPAAVSKWKALELEGKTANTVINGPYPIPIETNQLHKAIGSHHIPEVLGLIRKERISGYFSSVTVDLPPVLTDLDLDDNVKVDLWIKGQKIPRDWLAVVYTDDEVTISPTPGKDNQLKYAGFGCGEVVVRFTPYFGSEDDVATTHEVNFDNYSSTTLSWYDSEEDSPLTFSSTSDAISVYVNGRRLSEGFDLINVSGNVWQIINADFFKNYWLKAQSGNDPIVAKSDGTFLSRAPNTIEVIESSSAIIGTGTNIPGDNSSGFSVPGWYAGGANYHTIRGDKTNGLIFRDGIPVHGDLIPGPIQNDGNPDSFEFINGEEVSEGETVPLYGRHVEAEIVLPGDVVTIINDLGWVSAQADLASEVFNCLRRDAPLQSTADKIVRPRELYSPLVHRCMRDLSDNIGLSEDVDDDYDPADANPETFLTDDSEGIDYTVYRDADPFVGTEDLIRPWDQSFVDILPSYKNYPLIKRIRWLFIRDLLRHYVYDAAEGTPEVLGGLRWSGYVNH